MKSNKLPDSSRKKLLALCQQANQLLQEENSASSENFHSLLNDLAVYTREHFAEQEKKLRDSNSPLLDKHRTEHISYESQLTDILFSASIGILDRDQLHRFMSACSSLPSLQPETPVE